MWGDFNVSSGDTNGDQWNSATFKESRFRGRRRIGQTNWVSIYLPPWNQLAVTGTRSIETRIVVLRAS